MSKGKKQTQGRKRGKRGKQSLREAGVTTSDFYPAPVDCSVPPLEQPLKSVRLVQPPPALKPDIPEPNE